MCVCARQGCGASTKREKSILSVMQIPEMGRQVNRLFVCATTSLYAVYLNARGGSAKRFLTLSDGISKGFPVCSNPAKE